MQQREEYLVILLLALDMRCSSKIQGPVLQYVLVRAHEWAFLLGLRLVGSCQSL